MKLPEGKARFLGQDRNIRRRIFRGDSTANVLEFLRAAEGFEALRGIRGRAELRKGCQGPVGTIGRETRAALGAVGR